MVLPAVNRPSTRALLAGFVASGFCITASGLQAQTLTTHYGITMLGLTIGSANVSGQFTNNAYKIEASTKLSGFAAIVSSSKGSAVSTGALVKGQVLASTYATTSANSDITRTVRMAINSGTVKAIDIAPPFEDRPGRVPLTEESKRGIIDPLSAVIMGISADQPLVGPTACNRTLPVFDGYTRFNIDLTYVGTRQVKTRGYAGPVSVCAARYVPLAGHRPERSATKYMINNKQIEIWLAPVEKAHVAVPYRISVQTQVGMLVIEAQEFSVDESGQAAITR